MLEDKSFESAVILTGSVGLGNQISGINILEAVDIEKWGIKGDIILTSFFALQYLSEIEMEHFFGKMQEIEVSGLIVKMDRLIVMDQGQVVEQGTHKELVEFGGIYAQLWTHQTGGFIK